VCVCVASETQSLLFTDSILIISVLTFFLTSSEVHA